MKGMNLHIFLLLFFASLCGKAVGQNNITLKGSVKDSSSDEPLIGATIHFKGTSIGAITNVDGDFLLSTSKAGNFTLMVSYLGYEDYVEEVQLESGDVSIRDILLEYSGGVDLEGVVITAQAKGQYAAINSQLNASDIRNVVSSDRIRELPDANAAESLARLPGISLERQGGEGQKVIVRGLSPKYTKVMIDGVEMTSGAASSNPRYGQSNDDRSVSLGGISAYSLDGIEVVKAATSDMEGDFIGGAVNFKLRSAEEGFNVEAMASGTYTGLKSSFNNYNSIVSVSNRF